jgi:CDP-diacylglycerol--serine O-phosphatidyltransferase
MSCGFYSILASFKGHFEIAVWGILIANIFDGLDGWIARMTNSSTRFGIQLDSLSDLVAFGIAPAVLLYSWGFQHLSGLASRMGWGVSFFFVMCGALRLARYNVQMDTAESKAFTGMPIPAAATIASSFVLFSLEFFDDVFIKNHEVLESSTVYIAMALVFILGLLMVSTIRYHGLKELNLKSRKSFWFLVLFALLFFVTYINPPAVIFLASLLYMIWGISEYSYLFYKRRKSLPLNK